MDGILTITDTRNALILAAYEAERRAFSRPIIIGSFRRRGLWPCDPELMQANVKANLGLMETAETPMEAARRAASEVIQAAQARVQEANAGTSSGKAVLVRGVVHSPFLLLKRQREIEEDEAKEKAAKAAREEERANKRAEREQLKWPRLWPERTENAACVRARSTAAERSGAASSAAPFGCAPAAPSQWMRA